MKTIIVEVTDSGIFVKIPEGIDPEISVEVRDYQCSELQPHMPGRMATDEDGNEYYTNTITQDQVSA